ncbi:MAG: hypothetical protein EOO68_04125 [Moraxellaceae bacterium]|nr:MAG: hypothetical protein EOO68_04125 [Moraxellaceae bacterium]
MSYSSGGAGGPSHQCTRNVLFTFRKVDRIVAVTFFENTDVDTSVVEAIQKFIPRNFSLAGYELRRADDVILTSFQSVLDNPGDLRYAPQINLPIGSASEWDETCTSMLKIHLEEVSVDELLGGERTLSEEARTLIHKLQDLDANNSTRYFSRNISQEALDELRKDNSLIQPVRKCLYLISKYLTNEALVDSLISLLFHELGFYSGMLYPVPQHFLPLQYGGDVSATAKADFNVIDVLSFCRMIVAEDKNQASIRVNSFPQLVAESISAVQKNLETSASCKRKWQELEESTADSAMLGLRVNGTLFYFYNINVSRPILSAMKMKGPASIDTIMKMVGGSEGLNFLDPVQRKMIITILDAWRSDIEKKGRDSVRRLSN